MSLRKAIGNFYLKINKWTVVNEISPDLKKCVCIVAPHTSIEDFFVGWAFFWSQGLHFKMMMKAEFFKYPILRGLLLKLGAVPVNRGHRNNLVEQMIDMFSKNDEVFLVICPEATRKKVNQWKRGFYFIAEGAKQPIVFGFEDFQKKRCGFDKVMIPSGDYEKDLAEIWDYYKDIKAKFPEKFNLDEQYR